MALWFFEDGQADTQQVARAWTDDLDYMLRLNARRRAFEWTSVEEDMRQYVQCVASSELQQDAAPPDVTAAGLRKRWAYLDSSACQFYRAECMRGPHPPPASAVGSATTDRASGRAPSGAARVESNGGGGCSPPLQSVQQQLDGADGLLLGAGGAVEAVGRSMEAVLDSLDLDGLLHALEADQLPQP